ncbi:MAG: mandelate racemase/muconate lactonizing enzyme family protein [Litorilinea sp.]
MKIDSIDFFYLSMPEILDIGDGSQDALLVRVEAGGQVGWGECEAAPLPSIAAFICPMSHSACKPVQASVLGARLDGPEDIRRIGDRVRANSMDLLQAEHTLSGIDLALWDLLGRVRQEPVYRLLGYSESYPKLPYASMLFGDTPQSTLEKGREARAKGFRAAKFGWGPIGLGSVQDDADQFMAAREGLGDDGVLLVDAGTVWKADYDAAARRMDALQAARATWLEEPFVSGALELYRRLGETKDTVKMAGGEGAHNFFMAQHMIDYAGVGFIQIDAGRIGGITVAKDVADYAHARGVTYVNHTFTSHLALSASLQPFAGLKDDVICEYPVELKSLGWEMTHEHIELNAAGMVAAPDALGLGITPNFEALARYLVDVRIEVNGKTLYATPALADAN